MKLRMKIILLSIGTCMLPLCLFFILAESKRPKTG